MAFKTIKAYEDALKYGDGPSDRSAIMNNIAILCKKACKWEKSKGPDFVEQAFYWQKRAVNSYSEAMESGKPECADEYLEKIRE